MSIKTILTIILCIIVQQSICCANSTSIPNIANKEHADTTIQQQYFATLFDAQLLFTKKKYDSCILLLEQCRRIDNNAAINFELYKAHLSNNNISKALEYIKMAVKQDDTNKTYLGALASQYWASKDFKNVYEIYAKLHKLYPNSEMYLYNILYTLKNMQYYDRDRLKYLEKLEEISGYSEEIAFENIQIYADNKKVSKIFKEIDKAKVKFPYTAKFHAVAAELYVKINSLNDAIEELDEAINIEPENGNLIYYQSQIYRQIGRTKLADELKNEALNAANTSDKLRTDLIKPMVGELFSNKQTDSIYILFKKYLGKYPSNNNLKEYYISFLQEKKDSANITATYKELIASEPDNQIYAEAALSYLALDSAYLYNLVRYNDSIHNSDKWKFFRVMTYFSYKDTSMVRFSAKNIIPKVTNPTIKSQLYGNVGDLYLMQDSAIHLDWIYSMYDSALYYNHDNDMVLNNYAYTLFDNGGDIDKAERMSARAVQLNPRNTASLDTYAHILFAKKEYYLAKFYIEQLFKYEEDTKSINHEIYGDILYHLDQKDKAVEQWEKAYKQKPNDKTLKLKYETKEYHK